MKAQNGTSHLKRLVTDRRISVTRFWKRINSDVIKDACGHVNYFETHHLQRSNMLVEFIISYGRHRWWLNIMVYACRLSMYLGSVLASVGMWVDHIKCGIDIHKINGDVCMPYSKVNNGTLDKIESNNLNQILRNFIWKRLCILLMNCWCLQ